MDLKDFDEMLVRETAIMNPKGDKDREVLVRPDSFEGDGPFIWKIRFQCAVILDVKFKEGSDPLTFEVAIGGGPVGVDGAKKVGDLLRTLSLFCMKWSHHFRQERGLFVVRLFDGMDNQWMDVSEPVSQEEAGAIWNEKTSNGTRKTKFDDIDYYKVFPADTQMLYRDGFGEHVRD